VLEPLSGYLTLAEHLVAEGGAVAEAWNFGPAEDDAKPVRWIAATMAAFWGVEGDWTKQPGEHPSSRPFSSSTPARPGPVPAGASASRSRRRSSGRSSGTGPSGTAAISGP